MTCEICLMLEKLELLVARSLFLDEHVEQNESAKYKCSKTRSRSYSRLRHRKCHMIWNEEWVRAGKNQKNEVDNNINMGYQLVVPMTWAFNWVVLYNYESIWIVIKEILESNEKYAVDFWNDIWDFSFQKLQISFEPLMFWIIQKYEQDLGRFGVFL